MIPLNNFAQQLKQYKNVIAICGAGLSTASGIPDFRSPITGIYQNKKVDPNLLHVKTFANKNTKFWKNFVKFAELATDKQPNPAHYALAELNKMGVIKLIVEQNTDGLLFQAGAVNVIEVHGNLRHCYCTKCGYVYSLPEILEKAKASENIKEQIKCTKLTCRGLIKPNVVLFGGELPVKFHHIYKQAQLGAFDYALFVGTSMTVFPVAELADIIKNYAIFNNEPTQYSLTANFVDNDPLEFALPELLRNLK